MYLYENKHWVSFGVYSATRADGMFVHMTVESEDQPVIYEVVDRRSPKRAAAYSPYTYTLTAKTLDDAARETDEKWAVIPEHVVISERRQALEDAVGDQKREVETHTAIKENAEHALRIALKRLERFEEEQRVMRESSGLWGGVSVDVVPEDIGWVVRVTPSTGAPVDFPGPACPKDMANNLAAAMRAALKPTSDHSNTVQEAFATKYKVYMWTGSQDDHPFPHATKEDHRYFVNLEPDDIVALTQDYDVMISHLTSGSLMLALNKKGHRFSQSPS